MVTQQSARLTHATPVTPTDPFSKGPCIDHVLPASALARASGPYPLAPVARHHRSARQVTAVTSVTPLGAGTTDHVRPPFALTTKAPAGPDPASSCPPATHQVAGQETPARNEIGDGAGALVQWLPPSVEVSSNGPDAALLDVLDVLDDGAPGVEPTATAVHRVGVAQESAVDVVTPARSDERNEPGHGCAGDGDGDPDVPVAPGAAGEVQAAAPSTSPVRATTTRARRGRRAPGVRTRSDPVDRVVEVSGP